jgi:hypothetical protein
MPDDSTLYVDVHTIANTEGVPYEQLALLKRRRRKRSIGIVGTCDARRLGQLVVPACSEDSLHEACEDKQTAITCCVWNWTGPPWTVDPSATCA